MKNTSVQKIAEEIVGRYGLSLQFEGTDHEIEVKEQSETDSAFLQKLCETYGLCMKVYTEKLWIYDREAYKAKEAAFTVYRGAPADDPTALCVKRGALAGTRRWPEPTREASSPTPTRRRKSTSRWKWGHRSANSS